MIIVNNGELSVDDKNLYIPSRLLKLEPLLEDRDSDRLVLWLEHGKVSTHLVILGTRFFFVFNRWASLAEGEVLNEDLIFSNTSDYSNWWDRCNNSKFISFDDVIYSNDVVNDKSLQDLLIFHLLDF